MGLLLLMGDASPVTITGTVVCDPATEYTYTASARLPTPTYQWYLAGIAINGATSETYQRTVDWLDHNLKLTCVVTSGGRNYTSNSLTLKVGEAPVLSEWDRYVSTSGSDSNDGLTPATSWATLAPLETYMDTDARSGQTVRVRINSGTYQTHYRVNRTYTSPPTLFLDFASGVVIERGVQAEESCLEAYGNLQMRIVCHATGDNRLRVTGFATGTGNGFGIFNTADMRCWGVRSDGNLDGWTGHNSATGWLVDSDIRDNSKGGVIHSNVIGACTVARTTIVGKTTASSNVLTRIEGHRFIDCDIQPVKVDEPLPTDQAVFDKCRIGGTNSSYSFLFYDWATGGTISTFNDCFLRGRGELVGVVDFTRCYGYVTARVRGSTANPISTWDKCVFVGPPAGANYNSLIWNFSEVGLSPITVKDSIITGYSSTAIGLFFTATNITDWNATCSIENCCFFNNGTNINASISATASNTVTSNPLLGAANTVTQTDYAIATNSPCVGAGTSGGNIGFLVSELGS